MEKMIEIPTNGKFVLPKRFAKIFDFWFEEGDYENTVNQFIKTKREFSPSNCTLIGVYLDEDYIVFTSKESLKNWQYYAGLEYCSDPDTYDINGTFYAIYASHGNNNERIEEIINRHFQNAE